MSNPSTYELKYGSATVAFSLPEGVDCTELRMNHPSLQMEEQEILKIRLRSPLASRRLDEILQEGERILLVVPDNTRISRLDLFFPQFFEILGANRIPDSQVMIVFANGSHAGMNEEDKLEILGADAFNRFRHVEHNCRDAVVEKLGTTSNGTQIIINPLLKRHDKVIVISPVVHHYFAGFGGGPKMIVPGLAAWETIWQNHRLAVMCEDSPLHPGCEPGNLSKNPVYEDILEAVKMTKVDFAIQMVLDDDGCMVDAYCGNLFSSFQKASMKVQQLNQVFIPRLADVVVASAGGFPRDINLIQSHKAIDNAVRALKPGGKLIMLAECKEGYGNPDFLTWFEIDEYAEMKRMVIENFQLNANTALSLKFKLDSYVIYLVSELHEEITTRIGFKPAAKIDAAIEQAFASQTDGGATYIIPNASHTLPELK
ncbi:MAG: nickel-dependent lactate racemase [bacterium]